MLTTTYLRSEVVLFLLVVRGRRGRDGRGRLFPLPVAILGLFLRLLLFPTL